MLKSSKIAYSPLLNWKVQADKSTIARSTQSNTDSTDAKRYSFTIVYIVVQKLDPHCIITFPLLPIRYELINASVR
jgi:hypothetical protein